MATSMISSEPTTRPKTSWITSCSPGRCRKASTSIVPLRMRTPVGSMDPTRLAFTKMRRRCTDATNPSTRAGFGPAGTITTSSSPPSGVPSAATSGSRTSRDT
jgi:hypothetical protein